MLRSTRVLRAAEWSKTLHLPKSTFPPRPAPQELAKYTKQCADDLYAWQASSRPAENKFVLHDGPPYANGSLHIGHALNKIQKDIICRFEINQGKQVHYVPGWDCHGLPIEMKALQSKGEDHRSMTPVDIRKSAAKLAHATIKQQMKGFRAWGVMGDWENAYKTMDKDFEIRQLQIFKGMVEKGLIYRQYKPVHWSPSSGTALAEAELEYDENHESLAAYVGFRITHYPPALKAIEDALGDCMYLLIWTTTPWTLPANSAIGIHKDLEYCITTINGFHFVVATELLPQVAKTIGQEVPEILVKFPGSFLAERCQYVPSFCNSSGTAQPVLHADFVSGSSGTGLVHMAAGHGMDDFKACQQYGIEATAPVNDAGCFVTAVYPNMPAELEGISVTSGGSEAVIKYMQTQQNPGAIDWLVLNTHKYKHKYPIDWRTKKPVITRATSQWFADTGVIQESAIKALKSVKFIPESGRARLESFTTSRTQWCISRQRAWGVPIPALYRQEADGITSAVMTSETINHIIGVVQERGISAWWTDEPTDSAWVSPKLPPGTYIRGKDTMDVWFDSGTSWTSLPLAHGSTPPADVYLEGTDQHRGWFQSSLLTHIASQVSMNPSTGLLKPSAVPPHAPFRTLITHGFTLDGQGRKMSKSIGNVVSPDQIMDGTLLPPIKLKGKDKSQKQLTFSTSETASQIPAPPPGHTFDGMGPNALRLWAASADYTRDILVGEQALKGINQTLHKLRVTFKWLLGVLSDYKAPSHSPTSDELIRQIHTSPFYTPESHALHTLANLQSQVHASYAAREHSRAVQLVTRALNTTLSASWFESAKDALYAGAEHERAAAQLVSFEVLSSLLCLLGPVLPALVTEVLSHAPLDLQSALEAESRHPLRRVWNAQDEAKRLLCHGRREGMRILGVLGEEIRRLQERARERKRIGQGLECSVALVVDGDDEMRGWLRNVAQSGGLRRLWVVSDVTVHESGAGLDAVWEERGRVAVGGGVGTDIGGGGVGTDIGGGGNDVDVDVDVDGGGSSKPVHINVSVMNARHGKCPRCWQYVVEQGEEICGRCSDVVRGGVQ